MARIKVSASGLWNRATSGEARIEGVHLGRMGRGGIGGCNWM